jgi:Predicted metal-dependent hydrolase
MQEIVIIKGREIRYNLIRCARKSIGIKITPEKGVEVRVPHNITVKAVQQIIEEKAEWIQKKTELVNEKASLRPKHDFKTGEEILLLGEKYSLVIEPALQKKEEHIAIKENKIYLQVYNPSKEYIKTYLINWYKSLAKEYLTKKTFHYSEKVQVTFETVKITNPSKRWGSCTSKGNINYNWRIIMAPEEMIDYLVVHELAHRKEMNHSKRFYEILKSIMPDYKNREKWLKTNGVALDL